MPTMRYCRTCGRRIPSHRRYCNRECMQTDYANGRSAWKQNRRDPTPEQIRERCQQIQAGWTKREELSRRAIHTPDCELEMCQILMESGRSRGA